MKINICISMLKFNLGLLKTPGPDALLFRELAEQYTQCTLMCYLPPFTSKWDYMYSNYTVIHFNIVKLRYSESVMSLPLP